jgi:integrase
LGEVASIRVKDVSLAEQSIFLPVTKNRESRHVPMSPKLKEFVVNLVKGRKLEDKLIDKMDCIGLVHRDHEKDGVSQDHLPLPTSYVHPSIVEQGSGHL